LNLAVIVRSSAGIVTRRVKAAVVVAAAVRADAAVNDFHWVRCAMFSSRIAPMLGARTFKKQSPQQRLSRLWLILSFFGG
jgi:hypothetical protein